ncbi:MAG: hypothetical protein FJ303_22940 [Planctomycetes bacterium]|nr:hypothetical protein [Planctomycetota bacterium]
MARMTEMMIHTTRRMPAIKHTQPIQCISVPAPAPAPPPAAALPRPPPPPPPSAPAGSFAFITLST